MQDVNIFVRILGDSNPLVRAAKKAKQGIREVRQETEKATATTKQATTATNQGAAATAKATSSTNALNNSRKALNATTRKMAAQERFIGDAFGANAHKINKQYLSSINGLRLGLQKLNQESMHTLAQGRDGRLTTVAQMPALMGAMQNNLKMRFLEQQTVRLQSHFKNLQWTGRQMMVGVTAPIMAVGAAAVATGMQVDELSIRLEKLVDNGERSATEVASIMESLDEQARSIVSRLGTARTDVMSIQSRFAQTGFDESSIERGTKETVDLMAYGDVDQETATELVRQLAMISDGWGEVTDQLDKFNAMDDRTNLSLKDTAAALPHVFPLLQEFNISAAGTAGLMSGITQRGYEASEAATALRNAFTKIPAGMAGMDASSEGAQSRLKIVRDSLTDIQQLTGIDIKLVGDDGKIKDGMEILTNVMQGLNQLQQLDPNKGVLAMRAFFGSEGAGVGSALAQAFENRDSDLYKAMEIAMSEQGSLRENTLSQLEKVEEAKSTRLKAALEELRVAAQDLGLELIPIATKIVNAITKVLEAFTNLPAGAKAAAIGMLAAVALVGPVVYGFSQIGLVLTTMFRGATKALGKFIPGMGGLKTTTVQGQTALLSFNQALADLDRELQEGLITTKGYDERLEEIKEEYGELALAAEVAENRVEELNEEMNKPVVNKTGVYGGLQDGSGVTAIDVDKDKDAPIIYPGLQDGSGLTPDDIIDVDADGKVMRKAGSEIGEEVVEGVAEGAVKKQGLIARTFGRLFGRGGAAAGAAAGATAGPLANLKMLLPNLTGMFGRLGTAGAGAGTAINGSMVAASGGMTTLFTAAAPIAAILALIGVVIFGIWKNWDSVSKGIGDSFDKLKDAGEKFISAVLQPFKDILQRISGESEKGKETMGSMWEDLGEIIGDVIDAITRIIEIITPIAVAIAKVLSEAFFIVMNVVKLVVSALKGDWEGFKDALVNIGKSILNIMLDVAGGITSAFIMAFSEVIEHAIELVDDIVGAVGGLLSKIGIDVDWDDSLEGLKDSWTEKADLAGDYFRQEWNKLGFFRDIGEEAGEDIAEGAQDGADDIGGPELGEPTYDPEAAAAAGRDQAESFLDSFWNRMKGVVDSWEDAALGAFDDWAENQIGAIDAKIDAIDREVEAERKRQEDLDYLAKKDELRAKRKSALIKHQADRDLAIFEGRYDDAAQLDYEHDQTIDGLKRDEEDLERDRQQTLTDRVRDAEKERLEIQKDSLKEQIDEKREALQKELDAITEYIPKNAAEAEKMQQAIHAAMEKYTDGYGTIGKNQAVEWGKNWSTAWQQAVNDFEDSKAAEAAGQVIMEQFAKGLGLTLTVPGNGAGNNGAHSTPQRASRPGESYGTPDTPATRATGSPLGTRIADTIGMVSDAIFGQLNRHTGGPIGTSSMSPSDVPATLQTGEYVVRRSSVSKFGRGFMDSINRGEVPTFHTGGYVGLAKSAIGSAFGKAAVGMAHGLASMSGITADALKEAYAKASGTFGAAEGFGAGGKIDTSGMTRAQIVDNVVKGTHPGFKSRVAAWNAELGNKYNIEAGYRSMAEQARLYSRWIRGVPGQAKAARPGSSYHNFGLAIDLSPSRTTAKERELGKKYGLYWPMSYEPWHVQPVEAAQWKELILQGYLPGGSSGPAQVGNTGWSVVNGLFQGANAMAPLGGTVTAGREEIKSIVRGMLGRFGWGLDQWPALDRLVSGESSWNPSAANPSSSARGLFQKMTSIHGPLEPTIEGQANWGLNYIKQRYGSPSAAYNKWLSRSPHWYHQGGMVFPSLDVGGKILEDGIAKVHKNERVLTATQTQAYESGGGDVNIEFRFDGGYFGTDRELEKLVDTIESRIIPKINKQKGNSTRSFKTYK